MPLTARANRITQHLIRHSDRNLYAPHTDQGSWHRVRHGWSVSKSFWSSLNDKDQHLAKLLAAHKAAQTPPVFSHISAALLLDLPVYANFTQNVHTTTGSRRFGRATNGLVRHNSPLRDDEIIEINGLRCTAPNRTLFDLCKHSPPETALSFADSLLRSQFRVDRRIDTEYLEIWRETMAELVFNSRGARGIRAVPRILSLADPRKDSVLESLSHLQLHRLGFEVELQLIVRVPNGPTYHVDFDLIGFDVLGECDGKAKYVDPDLSGGASAEEIVYREKLRDDVLQGVTGKRVVHWGYSHALSPNTLCRQLESFNIRVPRSLR